MVLTTTQKQMITKKNSNQPVKKDMELIIIHHFQSVDVK